MRRLGVTLALLLGLCPGPVRGGGPFDGEWRTSLSTVKLTQDGKKVSGSYGNAGQFTIEGTAEEKVLTFEFREGDVKGDGKFTLDATGRAFTGDFQVRGGRGGIWNGWRPDPDAPKAGRGKFAGLWLTTSGLMEIAEDGDRVTGRYAARGTSDIRGDVKGRRLDFRFRSFRGGAGWFDLSADGKSLAGAAHSHGFPGWFEWRGRRAPEYVRHVRLEAGKTVEGSTKNLLTYSVRAPEGYKEDGKSRWPAVVILHGSNMDGRSYVETIAAAWPDIARDFLLLGINGETPSSLDNPTRFNFTYQNMMGRSTLQGYPGTDRESPALVSEAMRELKGVYPVARYFVGGHSQGGFLTYSLLMNYPEEIAGAFPISAALIIQCVPGVYDDADLKRAQRKVPLAIVHGRNDPIVDFAAGRQAADLFIDSGWPAFRFFTSEDAGHMFARLPVNQAIRWLEAQASDDPARLLDSAESRLKEARFRDAIAALGRARDLKPSDALLERSRSLARAIDERARPRADEFVARIRGGGAGWIDEFLAFRDDFEFADAAREAMAAFAMLRAVHEIRAKTLYDEAGLAFRQGRRDEGYSKYREIVDKYFASTLYREAKRDLADRK